MLRFIPEGVGHGPLGAARVRMTTAPRWPMIATLPTTISQRGTAAAGLDGVCDMREPPSRLLGFRLFLGGIGRGRSDSTRIGSAAAFLQATQSPEKFIPF